MSRLSLLLKYWNRVPFLIIYYGIARYLPKSDSPIVGSFCRIFRGLCCKYIFEKCGRNVNVDRMVLFGSGFKIRIGDNSGLGRNSVIPSDICIGNDVMMAPKCYILTNNHNYRDTTKLMRLQGMAERKTTYIGNDVWIGREVLLTPGRKIADGCVIAARTCLTKDFEPYSIIGGNPGKLIGKRDNLNIN